MSFNSRNNSEFSSEIRPKKRGDKQRRKISDVYSMGGKTLFHFCQFEWLGERNLVLYCFLRLAKTPFLKDSHNEKFFCSIFARHMFIGLNAFSIGFAKGCFRTLRLARASTGIAQEQSVEEVFIP